MVIKIVNYETNVQVNQFHLHPALSKEILMLGLGTAGLVYTHSEPELLCTESGNEYCAIRARNGFI